MLIDLETHIAVISDKMIALIGGMTLLALLAPNMLELIVGDGLLLLSGLLDVVRLAILGAAGLTVAT
jgi:hypothetical protein